MTDLNPAIWANPTLGEAGLDNFLDVVTAQTVEDDNAEIEGRAARTVVPKAKFPRNPPQTSESYEEPGWEYQ